MKTPQCYVDTYTDSLVRVGVTSLCFSKLFDKNWKYGRKWKDKIKIKKEKGGERKWINLNQGKNSFRLLRTVY